MITGCTPDPWDRADLWDRAFLDLGDMEFFGNYLAAMEAFLETERQECCGRLEALEEELRSVKIAVPSDGQKPPGIEAEEMWLGMVEGFANILRKSFFVSLYGWLESRLVEECHCRDTGWEKDAIIQEKFRKSGKLTKAMQYLIRVPRINFSLGESKEWNRIHGHYERLRHCIVHNEGKLNERYKHKTDLEEYVDREPTLTSSPYGDEIILSGDFCTEALSTIERFFVSVLVACGRVGMQAA